MSVQSRLVAFVLAVAVAIGLGAAAGAVLGPFGSESPVDQAPMPTDHDMTGE